MKANSKQGQVFEYKTQVFQKTNKDR